MKTKTLSIILILSFTQIYAQDVLYLKNGETKKISIIEKNNTSIKYRPDSITNQDTTYRIKLSKIEKIQFANGNIDLLALQNPRSMYPIGLNLGLRYPILDPPLLNCSANYFITPNISTEFGALIGLVNENEIFSYYEIGLNYWFVSKYSKSGFSPFVGYSIGKTKSNYFWDTPLGISYIAKSGFQSGLQINCRGLFNNYHSSILFDVVYNIGWRFKTKKH